jgi:hypothetical protein
MKCKLCEGALSSSEPDEAATQVCEVCRAHLGIVALPPSRRKAKPCAHCNGMKFVRVMPRELSAGYKGEREIGPMTASFTPQVGKMFLLGKYTDETKIKHGVGRLEMYICQGCGFVEWFCQAPESIPIGPEYMSEAIDYSSDAPYR